MVSEKTLDIDAPAAKIWTFLADFGNWTALTAFNGMLMRHSMAFRIAEGSVPGVGMRLEMVSKQLTQVWTAEEWDPPKRLRLTTLETSIPMTHYRSEIAITLTPKTSLTTAVELRYTMEPISSVFAMLQPLFGFQKFADKFTAEILDRLRSATAG